MAKNTDTLTRAFAQCRNVILFFSINKSRAFQGYVSASIGVGTLSQKADLVIAKPRLA